MLRRQQEASPRMGLPMFGLSLEKCVHEIVKLFITIFIEKIYEIMLSTGFNRFLLLWSG